MTLKAILVLIIQQTMAVALEVGISNLLTKFLADALVFFGSLQAAGAIATRAFQTITNMLDDFFVIV